jgi:hypothetical protein
VVSLKLGAVGAHTFWVPLDQTQIVNPIKWAFKRFLILLLPVSGTIMLRKWTLSTNIKRGGLP